MLRILLEAGFYIDRKDADGWTPLHAAAHWEQFDCCKILGNFFFGFYGYLETIDFGTWSPDIFTSESLKRDRNR